MSYNDDHDLARFDDYQQNPTPRPPAWMLNFVLAVGAMTLVVIGVMMLPSWRKQWLESDPEFILKMREVEARAEADLAFRRREAELKAEAEAAKARLDKVQIPPSPLRDVVARAAPAVVNISTPIRFRPDLDEFGGFRLPPFHRDMEMPRSEGSGVLVKVDEQRQAYVLTNAHVVQSGERLTVTLSSGRSVQVDPSNVWTDKTTDLAVLRFDASTLDHLTVAEFANSDEVQPGDWVLAIGSPFGLKQSVTFGIVSAKGRVNPRIVDDGELIQTDVAINPGNSGGPLLDLTGKVVGINTAIYTGNGGNQGVGFAIPSNLAQLIFERLSNPPHKVTRGFMGVHMAELSDTLAARLGIAGGVVVRMVKPALPAAEAGMQPGDIIIRFDRIPVTTMQQLRRLVMNTPPQTTVTVDIIRLEDGKPVEMSLRLTLTELSP
ncbi:MAG: trypsin-like peptidase domain-containing protein [Gemmatales bacterium]|nr:trypsin-like peptidase domain-containing protein [Gemmatales bacterium]MDW8387444.1 trypsin-like peptidase domain-containing protein [Gemmatales bacterium]